MAENLQRELNPDQMSRKLNCTLTYYRSPTEFVLRADGEDGLTKYMAILKKTDDGFELEKYNNWGLEGEPFESLAFDIYGDEIN